MLQSWLGHRAVCVLALFCVLSSCIASAAAIPPAPPPVEAFGHLPDVQFVAISPSGRWLARDVERDGKQAVAVLEVGTGKVNRLVAIDAANKLRDLEWADDEMLLIEASASHSLQCNLGHQNCSYEFSRFFAVRLDGSPPRLLLMQEGSRQYVTGARMLAARTARPGFVTMQTLDYRPTSAAGATESRVAKVYKDTEYFVSAVFDVDTRSGTSKPLAVGRPFTRDWVVDTRGEPIARLDQDEGDDAAVVVARIGKLWKEIYRQPATVHLDLRGVSMDGKSIVAFAIGDDGDREARSIALDGSGAESLYAVAGRDVDISITDPNTNAVVAVATSGANSQERWFDDDLRTLHRTLKSTFPSLYVELVSLSTDRQRAVISLQNASTPTSFRLVDLKGSRADVIGEAYPSLKGKSLGTLRSTSYLSRDGVDIPAFVILPPGREPKNLPLVVLPHGGPESHDTPSFDWLAQFLATRGYVVLQPQFRGSTGYGEAHRLAGYRQWGGRMQDDVSDGVRHLIADGTVDPTRVCIVGASYGGYAALAGAAFTPDLYACAASINGVSDLPLMLDAERRQARAIEYWFDHIGLPSDPNVAAKSPARSAASVRAPVLLLHGVDDSVVSAKQSEVMAKALETAGKPFRFVRLPGEDHYMSRSETRSQVLRELESFLAQNLH